MAHDLTTKIPLDFSFLYHPAESKISTKARHRGLNYWLKGYVHDIKLDDDQDKNILKITAKCYRSYKKSEVPHKLLMDIHIEKKNNFRCHVLSMQSRVCILRSNCNHDYSL